MLHAGGRRGRGGGGGGGGGGGVEGRGVERGSLRGVGWSPGRRPGGGGGVWRGGGGGGLSRMSCFDALSRGAPVARAARRPQGSLSVDRPTPCAYIGRCRPSAGVQVGPDRHRVRRKVPPFDPSREAAALTISAGRFSFPHRTRGTGAMLGGHVVGDGLVLWAWTAALVGGRWCRLSVVGCGGGAVLPGARVGSQPLRLRAAFDW